MADQTPASGGATGPSGFQAHDWYSYDAYLNVHFSHMERLQQEGIVLRANVSFREVMERNALLKVNVQGVVVCAGDVLVKVDKWLAVRRNSRRQLEVKGTDYAYHAWLRGRRDLLRYCSAHGLDDLHCHHFDLVTGEEVDQIRIELHQLPLLGDFISQAVEIGRQARRA